MQTAVTAALRLSQSNTDSVLTHSAAPLAQHDEIVGKRAQLELVRAYVRHIRVPAELKDRMMKHFQQRLQHASLSAISADDIYDGLPIPLQMEVAAHTNRALVGSVQLLRGCAAGFLDRLSSALRERELDAETVVFRAGEACKELLLLASGSVEAQEEADKDGDGAIEVLGPGDTLGEVPFVFGIRHFKTARVGCVKAMAFGLSSAAFKELLKSFPSQEDVIMDNTMNGHEGLATARSGKSKLSTARSSNVDGGGGGGGGGGGSAVGSRAGGGSRVDDGRSDAAGAAACASSSGLARILAEAKAKREGLVHAQLCTACAKGDYDKVRRLFLSRALDVNHGDFAGRRALHLAAAGGDTRILELLIAQRADVNVEDARGNTPIADAIFADHTAAAELIAKHGGAHGSRDTADAFCTAAGAEGGALVLRKLCLYGGNANAANGEARTPLHVAAAEGRLDAVRLLLDARADVHARDRRGATPLQDALVARQDGAAELLLAAGGRLGDFDEAEQLNHAVIANGVPHLARLLRFRCDVNAQDALGRTPLHLAASARRVNALSLLLDTAGVRVHAEDAFGNSALDDARRDACVEQQVLVALLLSHGGRPGSRRPRALAERDASERHVEAERAAAAAKLVAAREKALLQARAISAWVNDERDAVRVFAGQLERAVKLERERGAVLADEAPELWEQVYEYAEGFFDWREQAQRRVVPLVARWQQDTEDFALTSAIKLRARLGAALALAVSDAKPVERLYEVTFRKPMLAIQSAVR
jgi:ankyrin repeat protein